MKKINIKKISGGGYFSEDFFRATCRPWETTPKNIFTVLTRHELLYLFVYRQLKYNTKRISL